MSNGLIGIIEHTLEANSAPFGRFHRVVVTPQILPTNKLRLELCSGEGRRHQFSSAVVID